MSDDMKTSKATNETTSKATSNATGEAWEMTLSVIAALEQTREKALEGHAAAIAAGNGSPFAPGVRPAQHLVEALNEALRDLKPEAHKIAKSNGWALPEGV